MTEWRAIPGYEGYYEVSDDGQVRTLPRTDIRGVQVKTRTRALNPNASGYPSLALAKDGSKWFIPVHRLVMLAFIGPCPDGHEVLHADGTRTNNNLSNLSYGTRTDNVRDSLRHGTNVNANKTHCKRGHELNSVNAYSSKGKKKRDCRVCRRLRRRVVRVSV